MNALESGYVAVAPGAAAKPVARGPDSAVCRRSVLVALHRSCPLEGALGMGRLIAGALQAPLHGVVLAREPVEVADVPEHLGLPAEALRGLVLDVAVGEPREALAAALAGHAASFVVVGSAIEDARAGRLGLGDLAERALSVAGCGVVLVGAGGPAPRLRRMLLPLDGTPSTAAALTPVGQLARCIDAELDIVLVGEAHPHVAGLERLYAAQPAPPAPEHGAMRAPLYVDQPHHEWQAFSQEFLERFVSTFGRCPAEVRAQFHLGAGEPASEILRIAAELASELLVLVWHGDLSERHGSVFREVVRNAPCPVLVLRR